MGKIRLSLGFRMRIHVNNVLCTPWLHDEITLDSFIAPIQEMKIGEILVGI